MPAPPVLLVGAFCAGHALISGPGGPVYLPRKAGQILALGGLAAGLLQARLSSVHIGFGLAHFLLVVQLVKLYGPHESRDLRLIQVAGVFIAMVAGIWALELSYLAAFLLMALSLMANLIAMAMLPPGAAVSSVGPSYAAGVGSWRNLASAIVMPAAMVFACTMLLFMLLPRVGRFRDSYEMIPEQVTGYSENVSLHEVGQLRESKDVVLRAQFYAGETADESPIRPTRLLMRGAALPVYSDGQWFAHGFRRVRASRQMAGSDIIAKLRDKDTYTLRDVEVRSRMVRMRARVESRPTSTLFALYRVIPSLCPSPLMASEFDSLTHEIDLPRRYMIRPGETYEVVSLVPVFTPEQLDKATTPRSDQLWNLFWHIPEDIRPTLERVAREIERQYSTETDYQRIMAAQTYLLDPARFTYTFNLPEFGDKEPMEAFLTETRRGSCEQFSTALALLLRVWAIPTRLVVGFKGGEFDARDQVYTFRDKHAHAWVEVFFDRYGWVQFDPTPGANVVSEAPDGFLYRVTGFFAPVSKTALGVYRRARAKWGANVIGYSRAKQRRLFEGLSQAAWSLAEHTSALFRAIWPEMPDLGLAQVALLLVVITFAGIVVYVAARWLERRIRFGRRLGPGDATVPFYRQLLAILRKKGLRRPVHVTPREFARSAAAQLVKANDDEHLIPGALQLVTDLFYRVRFGGHELTDAEEGNVREALHILARSRGARRPRRRSNASRST
ncbi:MAG: transglutaminase TgpA family protein [Planctomycetota bacterium]